jgi:hypothetical protein
MSPKSLIHVTQPHALRVPWTTLKSHSLSFGLLQNLRLDGKNAETRYVRELEYFSSGSCDGRNGADVLLGIRCTFRDCD